MALAVVCTKPSYYIKDNPFLMLGKYLSFYSHDDGSLNETLQLLREVLPFSAECTLLAYCSRVHFACWPVCW